MDHVLCVAHLAFFCTSHITGLCIGCFRIGTRKAEGELTSVLKKGLKRSPSSKSVSRLMSSEGSSVAGTSASELDAPAPCMAQGQPDPSTAVGKCLTIEALMPIAGGESDLTSAASAAHISISEPLSPLQRNGSMQKSSCYAIRLAQLSTLASDQVNDHASEEGKNKHRRAPRPT